MRVVKDVGRFVIKIALSFTFGFFKFSFSPRNTFLILDFL